MQDVSSRLGRLEDRLQRLLASGLRNVNAEAAELAAEGEALAGAGMPELGARVRRVAVLAGGGAGPGPVGGASPGIGRAAETDALAAVALALAACRLLRARLPADAPPPGPWGPLEAPTKRQPARDRVVPICRVPLGAGSGAPGPAAPGGEAWACVRLRGTAATELILVRPPDGADTAPWLRQALEGTLRWQERHLLGASGEYQVCAAAESRWISLEENTVALTPNDPRKDTAVFAGGGGLKLVELAPDDLSMYAWLSPGMAEAARMVADSTKHDPAQTIWALAWVDGALVAPLALLVPGGFLRRPRLIHLIQGAPAEPVSL